MSVVTLNMQPQFNATQTPTSSFLSSGALSITELLSLVYTNGTTADKIDLISVKTYTFTGTTPQTASLVSMLDILGAAVNFAHIRMVLWKLYGTTTDGVLLTLGNAASNAWTSLLTGTGTLILQAPSAANPNGAFGVLAAPNTTGWVVGASNKDILMTPSASRALDLILAGASA